MTKKSKISSTHRANIRKCLMRAIVCRVDIDVDVVEISHSKKFIFFLVPEEETLPAEETFPHT